MTDHAYTIREPPDLVTRLRWHAMDRSNLYCSLTAEAAKTIEAAMEREKQLTDALTAIEQVQFSGTWRQIVAQMEDCARAALCRETPQP